MKKYETFIFFFCDLCYTRIRKVCKKIKTKMTWKLSKIIFVILESIKMKIHLIFLVLRQKNDGKSIVENNF